MLSIFMLAVLLLLLVVVVVGIVVVVLLIRSENATARTIGWTLLCVSAVVPVVFVGLFTVRTAEVATQSIQGPYEARLETIEVPSPPSSVVTSPLAPAAPPRDPAGVPFSSRSSELPPTPALSALAPRDSPTAAWMPEVDLEFDADLYPSDLAAVRALSNRARKTLDSRLADSTETGPLRILVSGDFDSDKNRMIDGQVDRAAILRTVVEEFRKTYPTQVRRLDDEPESDSDQDAGEEKRKGLDATVEVSLAQWKLLTSAPRNMTRIPSKWSGTFEIILTVGDETPIRLAERFVQKPWVESLASFESTQPDGRRFVVARSPRFASTESEARRTAIAEAIRIVPGTRKGDGVYAAIHSGELIVDRFTQQLSRSYGDVWREAILVDVTPDRLAMLNRSSNRAKATARAETISTVTGRLAGFLALLIVAAVCYFLLNVLTRGYYRMPIVLVVGTVVVLVAVSAMVLWTANTHERPAPLSAQESAYSL